jgi:DMSO/TMAO reductase YedYZ molybdopterin-dependent catalytic subunit
MAVTSALLRLYGGVSLHSELGGDLVLPHVPVDQFLALLGRLGGPLMAKELALLGDLPGLVGAGLASGVLFAAATQRFARGLHPTRSAVVFVLAAVAIAWLGTLAVLWPVAGAGYTGLPVGAARAATAAGLLLTYAVFGGALLAYRTLAGRRGPRPGPGGVVSRRSALLAGSGLALAAATGLLARQLLERSDLGYDGLQYRGTAPITPVDEFYVVTKNLIDPRVEASNWKLEVVGLVDRPASYSLDALRKLTATEHEMTLECISNYIGGGLISNARWKGVSLPSLLGSSGIQPGASQVNLRSVDGYVISASLEEAMDPLALIAYEMNGAALPDRHGFPARALMPRNYGEFSAKWITQIEVTRGPEVGYYELQGWNAHFVHTMARFSAPRNGHIVARSAGPIRLAGIAFAAGRGISKVEVSTDGGATWRTAALDIPGTRASWTLWSLAWTPSAAGRYSLGVRAVDGEGNPQTARDHGTAPAGATGFHRIDVVVA